MKSDKQIKAVATQEEKRRVFKNFETPQDIYADCSDGLWIKKVWRDAIGKFGWENWQLIK